MSERFAIGATAHHPGLKSVFKLSDDEFAINLGGKVYSHVSLIVSLEEWRSIVRGVDAEVARLDAPTDSEPRFDTIPAYMVEGAEVENMVGIIDDKRGGIVAWADGQEQADALVAQLSGGAQK